ncbi:hypothetical protein PVT67_07805 [Gallaecimonas kandeliae]|uniref:hypothetical protein n=1 Tax=Gallaecimonas kandeliae TaxID=3029055 RepID=UPI002649149A|nr:hypothetical protein [Gallaecimonas kandeliae]WKE67129.1 hypothetical protein PVT67_07805 [Gallaecimonas kandeliae]
MELLSRIALLAAALSIAACTLDRTPIIPPATLHVSPSLFCPGDSLTVSWDARSMARSPGLCALLGRDYRRPVACADDRSCPSGGTCLDGYCCPGEVFSDNQGACPTAAGCYPPFNLSITSDTSARPLVDGDQHIQGEISVTPDSTTHFLLHLAQLGAEPFERSQSATLIQPGADTQVLHFLFGCNGATPGWQAVDLNALASEHVRIVLARNSSGHSLVLSGGDPLRGPVTLAPGESTELLNGKLTGRWQASLSPLDPAALQRPQCLATQNQGGWPDLEVTLVLACVAN